MLYDNPDILASFLIEKLIKSALAKILNEYYISRIIIIFIKVSKRSK